MMDSDEIRIIYLYEYELRHGAVEAMRNINEHSLQYGLHYPHWWGGKTVRIIEQLLSRPEISFIQI